MELLFDVILIALILFISAGAIISSEKRDYRKNRLVGESFTDYKLMTTNKK